VEVSNDTLHIIADNPGEVQYDEAVKNYNQTYYTSARLNTKTTGGHWYPGMEVNGTIWSTIRVEAQLKTPRGPGVVSAFWMLPIDNSCYPEIDIFETSHCDRVSMGMWYVNKSTSRGISKHGTTVTEPYDKFCDEFVTYAVELNEDYIAYYVGDSETPVFVTGKETWEGKCDANNTDAPYDRPFYIILNTAIGSKWGGIPTNDIFPAILEVDYVRVSGVRDE
jgi:beta-glucanase (GH16 family)